MNRLLIVISTLFIFQITSANSLLEKGFPYIRNFDLSDLSSNLQNWMSVQTPNGYIYVANSSRLFEFDGLNWNTYSLPNNSALRALETDTSGRIYVGGTREFGYFYPDQYGRLNYYSLSDQLDTIDFESVWRVLKTSNGIYYVAGRKHIFKYTNTRLQMVAAPPAIGDFRASVINDEILFYDVNAGFGKVVNDTMRVYRDALLPPDHTVYFFMPGKTNNIIAGVRQQGLFHYTPQTKLISWEASLKLSKENIKYNSVGPAGNHWIKPVSGELNRLLKKAVTYYAVSHKHNYYIATLRKGLIIVDHEFNIINNYRKNYGITSDAVYHIQVDKQENLWLTGEMGLSFVRYRHPFRYFDELNKINGVTISVKSYRNEVFLGTTQGLFSITQNKGRFGYIHDLDLVTDEYTYVLDIEPIPNHPDNLIFSSLRDIVLLNLTTGRVQSIASFYGTYDVEKSPFANDIFLLGHTEGIGAIKLKINSHGTAVAKQLHSFQNFEENVRKMVFDNEKRLWVATGYNGVFRLELDANLQVQSIKKYSKANGLPFNDKNTPYFTDDTLFMATRAGVMWYDKRTETFKPYADLYEASVFDTVMINTVLPAADKIWFGLNKGVMYFDRINRRIEKTAFRRLSNHGTEGIDKDENGNIWLASLNQAIAIDTTYLFEQYMKVPLMFRKVTFGEDSLMALPAFKVYRSSALRLGEIPFSHNSLQAQLACPAYQSLDDMQFSYKLKGLSNKWSAWNNESTIDFSYLPGGDYQLIVKARDANNQVIGTASARFSIAPPYYLTAWAIAIYIVLAALIIYAAIHFNSRRLQSDKKKLQKRINDAIATVQQQKEELELQTQHLAITNKELEKLSIVAEYTDNAVAIMDGKGYYQWINKGFTRMYGYEFDELLQDQDREKIGKHANLRMNDLINIWFGDKKPIIYESLNKCKDGSEIWVQTALTPILDSEGNVDKLITIDTDIRKLKEAEQEIQQQRDEIRSQRDIAVKQRDEIRQQKQEITDSIHYAQRIQEALFPSTQTLSKVFKENFVFDLPRDIVSGDFYWVHQSDDVALLAVADCTGHGVPGAFMSLIGLNFLNEIVISEGIKQPDKVLNSLRTKIINALRQSSRVGDNKDGMDIALISYDANKRKLSYAGANNVALVKRNEELIELEPDKMPISIFRDIQIPFKLKALETKPGDMLYMFSDGYTDQFGGTKGKKFKTVNFRKLISTLPQHDLEKQEHMVVERFKSWKGDIDQIDDVLVVGVKLV
ncbi:SpoIIE family protein phosphatase [Salinivirga cyanobacteriivorans]